MAPTRRSARTAEPACCGSTTTSGGWRSRRGSRAWRESCRSEGVRAALAAALLGTGHPESRFRVTWAPPRLFVSIEPSSPCPSRVYRDGVWCVTVPLHRDNPQAKDTRFIRDGGYRLRPAAARRARRADGRGRRRDPGGPVQQLLRRPRRRRSTRRRSACSPGLTRPWCWRWRRACCRSRRARCGWTKWHRASECFITSASRGVLPVVRIDEATIGSGTPGPLAQEIRQRYERQVEAEAADVTR